MKRIGMISVTKGGSWAATDDVLSRFAMAALNSHHKVAISVDHSLTPSQHLQSLAEMGCRCFARRAFRPHRIHAWKQAFYSDFKALESFQPDVIIFSAGSILDQFHLPEVDRFLASTHTPIVYLCHGHSELYEVPDRKRLRRFLRKLAAIVFISAENLLTVESQIAESLSNSHVIHNAPSIQLHEALPWPEGDQCRFATVSRLDAFWKGHRSLLRILAGEKWQSRSWHLDVFGSGPDEDYIKELATYYKIAKRVTLQGFTNQPLNIWQDHHALIHPSWAESLSLSVIEALMAGRPVICTDVGDLNTVVSKAGGFVADAATPFSFSKALDRAWASKQHWQTIGLEGHRMASELVKNDPAQRLLDVVSQVAKRTCEN